MAGSVSGYPKWYFTRKEIEENSPSRRDGIDLKKEAYLRKSYCSFLQELGMKLKVPQVTIATAIILCHRFFLHQSHAKNDRKTIAAVCMFLSGKSEETPRTLRDVIVVSYEIIHKKDPTAFQKIKQQKEVYEQQKELFILAERVVLTTLGFDLCITHSYGPLVEAIKRFKVPGNSLAQVAWNFVNDGLRTSLCLQFKPKQIAAGAIFLAAKFLKVKLPTDGEKAWWQEFDVTPRQLEDVSNQLLELYDQNSHGQYSHGNEASMGTVTTQGHSSTPQDKGTVTGSRELGGVTSNRSNRCQSRNGSGSGESQISQYKGDNRGITDNKVGVWDQNVDGVGRHRSRDELGPPSYGNINSAESSSHLGKAEFNDVEVTKRKREVSTEK